MSPTPSLVVPGFCSLDVAHSRAREKWRGDWPEHFRGLLVTGRLAAWLTDESGNVEQVDMKYWISDEGKKISAGLSRDLPARVRLPIFQEDDLDREIPYELAGIMERHRAAKAGRLAKRNDAVPPVSFGSAARAVGSSSIDLKIVKSDAEIVKVIMQVYSLAEAQKVAIPNNRRMIEPVNKILARSGLTANPTRIEAKAADLRDEHNRPGHQYYELFCKPGETAAKKGLKVSNELIIQLEKDS